MGVSNKKTHYFALIGAGVLTILLAVCVVLLNMGNDREALNCSATTTGTVIDYRKVPRTKKSPIYPTTYTYTVDGNVYQCEVTLSDLQKLEIGDDVTVHYNPSNPDECYTDADSQKSTINYIGSCFLGLFGIVMIIGGIYFIIVNKRSQASSYDGVSSYTK